MQYCGADHLEYLKKGKCHQKPEPEAKPQPVDPKPEKNETEKMAETKELIDKNKQVLQLIEKSKTLEANNRLLKENFAWANEERKTWSETVRKEYAAWEADRNKLTELIHERDKVIADLQNALTIKTTELEKKIDGLKKPPTSPRKEEVFERLAKPKKK